MMAEKFDVVVIGDLIEHLSNPGSMLACVNKHLPSDGMLIISTPNPYTLDRSVRALFTSKQPVNPEHTTLYTKETLSELLRRYGFVITNVFYTNENPDTNKFIGAKNAFLARIVNLLKNSRPHFMETCVYICRKT